LCGRGRLARASLSCYFPSRMTRNYEYSRCLPHYQKHNRALFVTFASWHRWILPNLARDLALEACLYANCRKCTLHAVVIMPDHAHLIFTPMVDENRAWSIPEIMQAIKSESSHRINKALCRRGRVWQDESFDHVLRSQDSLSERVSYIVFNPVRAGLVTGWRDYRWLWWDSTLFNGAG